MLWKKISISSRQFIFMNVCDVWLIWRGTRSKHLKYMLTFISKNSKTFNITWTNYIVTQCNDNFIRSDLLFYNYFFFIQEILKNRRNFGHLKLNLVDSESTTLAPDCYHIMWTACSPQTELLPRLGGHTEAHSGHHHSLLVMVKQNRVISEGQSNGISYE